MKGGRSMYKKLKHDLGYLQMTEKSDPHALMDIGIYHLAKGDELTLFDEEDEMAILPLEASLQLIWSDRTETIQRQNVFDEAPYCLHICRETTVKITALEESEILVQKTNNETKFEAKLYTPEQCQSENAGEGVWGNTAFRTIRTIFDYTIAPYSNLVIGEVISHPGRWSSYPPHTHPQPEVYYYRFDRPQGFGCAMVGEEAYRVENHSFITIPGGLDHPQSTAPGYAMYFCWMIRHLENNPWTARIFVDEHKWLLEEHIKIWPNTN